MKRKCPRATLKRIIKGKKRVSLAKNVDLAVRNSRGRDLLAFKGISGAIKWVWLQSFVVLKVVINRDHLPHYIPTVVLTIGSTLLPGIPWPDAWSGEVSQGSQLQGTGDQRVCHHREAHSLGD